MTLTLDSKVRQHDEALSTELEGRMVMMSVEHGEYFGANELGTRLWTLLESPRTVSELCRAIEAEYEVEPATCEADVLAYLQELLGKGLIRLG